MSNDYFTNFRVKGGFCFAVQLLFPSWIVKSNLIRTQPRNNLWAKAIDYSFFIYLFADNSLIY